MKTCPQSPFVQSIKNHFHMKEITLQTFPKSTSDHKSVW